MHFQLYIPDELIGEPQLLERVGLSDFVQGAEFLTTGEGPGPILARPGQIVAWRKPGKAAIGYQPAVQTWFPAVARDGLEAGRYWIGLWNEHTLTPADIARPYPKPGRTVTLGDGQEWLLPIAKELPADLILQDDGSWRYEVQRQFHAFYLGYLRWLAIFGQAQDGDTFEFADAAEFVLQALRINYRLLPEIASRLRLFTTENVSPALFAILKPE